MDEKRAVFEGFDGAFLADSVDILGALRQRGVGQGRRKLSHPAALLYLLGSTFRHGIFSVWRPHGPLDSTWHSGVLDALLVLQRDRQSRWRRPFFVGGARPLCAIPEVLRVGRIARAVGGRFGTGGGGGAGSVCAGLLRRRHPSLPQAPGRCVAHMVLGGHRHHPGHLHLLLHRGPPFWRPI